MASVVLAGGIGTASADTSGKAVDDYLRHEMAERHGIRASFFVYPKDDLAVIVLTNTQGSRPESLVEGVAQRYFARSD
jgi:hypothetical protein